ncbi:MAG: hypothetical protein LC808_09925 [Actinobacteria bacterium]|nr:hypothetical protein [Actinomycetota bacterium]
MGLAAWSVNSDGKALQLKPQPVPEKLLENWLTEQPDLAMEGIAWVARQLVLPDHSRLDLLGVAGDDWVIAELKRGGVSRSTLAQALHYLVYIGSMPREQLGSTLESQALFNVLPENRKLEVRDLLAAETTDSPRRLSILLAGTYRDSDLDLGIQFLEDRHFDVPIRVVTFDVFEAPSGQSLLVREADDAGEIAATTPARSLSAIRERAQARGVAALLDGYLAAASELGLRVKPWVRAVTITPAQRGNPTLLYLRPEQDVLHVWPDNDNLHRYLGFDETDLSFLGAAGDLKEEGAVAYLDRFRSLAIAKQTEAQGGGPDELAVPGTKLMA